MSQQTPPPEGQIHTPNPLEIFWETNRKTIIFTALAVVLIVVGRWAWKEKVRVERNETWGAFAEKTGLTDVWAPTDAKLPSMGLSPKQMQQYMRFFLGQVHENQWNKVKGHLNENLSKMSEADIEYVMKTFAGTPAALWAEWVLACKYRAMGESDKVESTLSSLKKKAPAFEAFHKTSYPPVFVPEPKKKDGEKKKRGEEPILQAEDDSIADVVTHTAKAEAAFRKSHPDLYTAPEPEGRTVLFETGQGVIEVRLYEKASPKTCAQFLGNVEKGLYKDLYFYEIWKNTDANKKSPKLAFFGSPNAKDADQNKWTTFQSEKTIPFESNRLSHFPYMLCAVRQDDRKDSDTQQVYFTDNDCADTRDGDYVIFGRVVNDEGKSLIDKMVTAPLLSTPEEEAGKGKPGEPVLVKSVVLKK